MRNSRRARIRVHRAIYVRNPQIDGFYAVRIYWRICVFCANARPRTLGTLPDDASRLMRGVPTHRLVGLRPPPCVVPPRKPIGFRQRTETRKPPSWHTKAHEISRSNELLLRKGIFSCLFVSGFRPAFVTGATMKPAGLAVAWTRRPAKPGRGADAAAPSRHQATHRGAGFVVARSAPHRIDFGGVEHSASVLPMRRPPHQTVRADFPHTASRVKLVSSVSFPRESD